MIDTTRHACCGNLDKCNKQPGTCLLLQDDESTQSRLRNFEGKVVSGLSGSSPQYPDFQTLLTQGDQDVYYYILYTAKIELGNPPQPFRAQVDIGWGDVFVPSWNCTYNSDEAGYCLPHNMYNSSQSSSYEADLSPARVHYTGLYTFGNVSQDSLHVGGVEIKNQVFEEALMWRPVPLYWDELLDSALGLARLPLNFSESTLDARNPFQNMIRQNLLDKNVFSLRLARTDEERGELLFGNIDKSLYNGDLVTVPTLNATCGDNEGIAVYSSSGWQIPVQSIALNAHSGSGPFHANLPNYTAILSTSFPYIGLPPSLARQFTKHCGADVAMRSRSCEERKTLPDLTINLGPDGQKIVLTPWDYMFEVEDKIYGTRCILPFDGLPDMLDGFEYIMLGTAFLNGLYSVFDYDNQTISRKFCCFPRYAFSYPLAGQLRLP